FLVSEAGPRIVVDTTRRVQAKEPVALVAPPHVPASVLGDRAHVPAGNSADRQEPVVLEGSDPAPGRHPDPSALVLEEGMRGLAVELPVAVDGASGGKRAPPVTPPVLAPPCAPPDPPPPAPPHTTPPPPL